jgi:uncharacterized membrane protein
MPTEPPPSSLENRRWWLYAWISAAVFALLTCYVSWFRWATYQYASFDLAFYVQGFHQCLQGRFDVSLLGVPILGNHAEPLIFVLVPLFALVPHPMLLVVAQNLALATMAPVGYRIARRLGLAPRPAFLLGLAAVLAPATGFVALHEFHPEALSAPLLLLLFEARLRRSLGGFWLWFVLVLACKENLALLLIAYCAMIALADWIGGRWRDSVQWAILPALAAAAWFLLYALVISPAINAGNVDYASLYSHLGGSPTEILTNFIIRPNLAIGALGKSLATGDLVWGLLLPFLCLPLLRPQWLIVAAPLLAQHLLSWRASEWSIHYHYAAPLIPILWMATVETIADRPFRDAAWKRFAPAALLLGCLVGTLWIGPLRQVAIQLNNTDAAWERARVASELVEKIPPDASVTAPMPYLSHLAQRRELHSLHHVLKGLKTLSRNRLEPFPPTDYVLIDYGDPATFNRSAGFYHPALYGQNGESLPSSDMLLQHFLTQAPYHPTLVNAFALLERRTTLATSANGADQSPLLTLADNTHLDQITLDAARLLRPDRAMPMSLVWTFPVERELIPWAVLRLENTTTGAVTLVPKGLSMPSASEATVVEDWNVVAPRSLAAGQYRARLVFVDMPTMLWRDDASLEPPTPATHLGSVELGLLKAD